MPDVGTRWTYSRGVRACSRRSRFADARFRAVLDAHLRPLMEEHRRLALADWQERYIEGNGLGGELVGIRAALDGAPLAHRRPWPEPPSALEDARRAARARLIGEEWRASLLVSQPDPRRFLTIVEG